MIQNVKTAAGKVILIAGMALFFTASICVSPITMMHAFAQASPDKKPASTAKPTASPSAAKPASAKPVAGKPAPDAKKPAADKGKESGSKPLLVATMNDWSVYISPTPKNKTCYALAQPKDRQPAALKRDPAYIFISTRPGEGVRNEVSVIMGFAMKEGGDMQADVGGTPFDLVAKGTNAWLKNPAEEGQLIDAMKKSAKMTVKAPSIKGNVTTDSYSLSGLSQALERVRKECP